MLLVLSLPSQDWLTLLPLPVNVRTLVLLLLVMVSVQLPGLVSVIVSLIVVVSWTPSAFGEMAPGEIGSAPCREGVVSTTMFTVVFVEALLPAWSVTARVAV